MQLSSSTATEQSSIPPALPPKKRVMTTNVNKEVAKSLEQQFNEALNKAKVYYIIITIFKLDNESCFIRRIRS